MAFGLSRHQTQRGVEDRGLLDGRGTNHGDGNHVGSLLQKRDGFLRCVLEDEATGNRHRAVAKTIVASRRHQRRTQRSDDVVAEGLLTVQIDDDAVPVANVQNHAGDQRPISDREGVFVQLELVWSLGETVALSDTPARSVFIEPVGRDVAHPIKPLFLDADGGTTQVERGVVALLRVEARLQHQFLLSVRQNGEHGEVGAIGPVGAGAIDRHVEALRVHT